MRMVSLIEEAACIVLVSHDMAAINKICSRVIWLDHGKIIADGLPEDVVKKYMTGSA